jgi:hypothetical protein
MLHTLRGLLILSTAMQLVVWGVVLLVGEVAAWALLPPLLAVEVLVVVAVAVAAAAAAAVAGGLLQPLVMTLVAAVEGRRGHQYVGTPHGVRGPST